jgi:hypothetical protein
METSPESARNNSKVVVALVFLMHQLLATVFIIFSGWPAFTAVLLLPGLVGVEFHRSLINAVAGPPFFAAQMLWALFLGWSLGGFLRHRTMLWVWALPAVVLGYMYLRFPHCPTNFFPAACMESRSAYDLYFGRYYATGPSYVYKVWVTFPFLASTAYSLGAWLAGRINGMRNYAEAMMHMRVERALLALELILEWHRDPYRFSSLGWYARGFSLLEFALFFGVATYMLMVAVGLAGRRFTVTRWFLDDPASTVAAEPNE